MLLSLAALYPCAALVGLAARFVLAPLNRLMHEDEKPDVARVWVAFGATVVGAGLALWLSARAPGSDVLFLRFRAGGLAIDRVGPLGVGLLSVTGLCCAVAMRPQAGERRMPSGLLLLALGAATLALLSDDVRQAAAMLAATFGLLALMLRDPRKSTSAPLLWFVAALPGLLTVLLATVALAARAGSASPPVIREAIALEYAANAASIRWLVLGLTWLATVPALPWLLPDALAKRPLGVSAAVTAIPAALSGWMLLRLVFTPFPYAEAWEPARATWLLPLLALAGGGLAWVAAFQRAPSPRALLSLAALGPLVPLAFCLGRPKFGEALAVTVAVPLVRIALLASQVADPGKPRKPAPARLTRIAAIVAPAVALHVALLLAIGFRDWRFGLLCALVVSLPTGLAGWRMARFAITERARRHPVPVWMGICASVAAIVGTIALVGPGSPSASLERELGLDVHTSVSRPTQTEQSPGAPPHFPEPGR